MFGFSKDDVAAVKKALPEIGAAVLKGVDRLVYAIDRLATATERQTEVNAEMAAIISEWIENNTEEIDDPEEDEVALLMEELGVPGQDEDDDDEDEDNPNLRSGNHPSQN